MSYMYVYTKSLNKGRNMSHCIVVAHCVMFINLVILPLNSHVHYCLLQCFTCICVYKKLEQR